MTVFGYLKLNDTREGFYFNSLFAGKAFVADIAGKTARTVAALLNFTAFSIVDTLAKIAVGLGGDFHRQNLVATNPKMPVGNFTNMVRLELKALGDEIDNDKIITQAMHFGKT